MTLPKEGHTIDTSFWQLNRTISSVHMNDIPILPRDWLSNWQLLDLKFVLPNSNLKFKLAPLDFINLDLFRPTYIMIRLDTCTQDHVGFRFDSKYSKFDKFNPILSSLLFKRARKDQILSKTVY